MNYMISRDGQEYGPYSLGDLQRYVASGDISLTDQARSEGMTEFLPVSQVIGTIPVPPTLTHVALPPAQPEYPDPPNLPWGLVLLFAVLTCGLFLTVWGIVLAVWTRKLSPKSRALYYYLVDVVCLAAILVMSFVASAQHTPNPFVGIVQLVSAGFSLAGRFSMTGSLEEHYNSAEQMGVDFSGVMTFFFGEIYIQYHLNDVVRRRKLDRLDRQSALR